MNLEPVIGLEIHVQLATRTKMFCGCELSFGEEPNTRTCPVCLGMPGSLPVTNARAIHFGLMMGMALDCEIAPRSIFHRKNYFYPDLAKGYQISQYDIPLCTGGRLGDVRLHRIHLEEDAAKLVHLGESGRIHGSDASIVDYNRGGTPLAEIVTEPDLRSAEQAREWLNLLRVTLRQLGVSDVNMEEGSLRCDANVSVRPEGSTELGTKTELKNMNSFRFLERGINAEIERQTRLVEAGEPVQLRESSVSWVRSAKPKNRASDRSASLLPKSHGRGWPGFHRSPPPEPSAGRHHEGGRDQCPSAGRPGPLPGGPRSSRVRDRACCGEHGRSPMPALLLRLPEHSNQRPYHQRRPRMSATPPSPRCSVRAASATHPTPQRRNRVPTDHAPGSGVPAR